MDQEEECSVGKLGNCVAVRAWDFGISQQECFVLLMSV